VKFARKLLVLVVMSMLVAGIAYAGGKKEAKPDELDAAVRDTSNYLNSTIPAGNKIVILNIQSDTPALSDYIIDELIANAVNDKLFSVVDRHQLDAIRAEQNFQLSGEVADNQALEIGKFFGAQTIISGAISLLGNGHRLRVRALNVETAVVQGQFNRNIATSELIATIKGTSGHAATSTAQAGGRQQASPTQSTGSSAAVANTITIINNTKAALTEGAFSDAVNKNAAMVIFNFGGNISSNSSKTVTLPRMEFNKSYNFLIAGADGSGYGIGPFNVTQGMTVTISESDIVVHPVVALKIGDTGPAGGIIFYDKRNNNGGWRYLEAAPVEAEFQAVTSVRYTAVENTQLTIGSGKRNTQLYIETYSKVSGEWDTAAQVCAELEFGGFKDWYIPSRDELDQIYGQLKRRNLGDFKNGWYWSSSINDNIYPFRQNFSNGEIGTGYREWRQYVRPIRQVAGPAN